MSIRVVIADDHNVVRKGIRDLLSDEDDITVIGEASNAAEAIAFVGLAFLLAKVFGPIGAGIPTRSGA